MKIEQIIGRRVRAARKRHQAEIPSQAALGRRMGEYLGVEWSRQAVSYAESGQRDFKAAELVALALALNVPLTWLLEPEGATVEIADGGVAIPDDRVERFLGMRSGTHDLDGLASSLFRIRDEAERTLDSFGFDVRHQEEVQMLDKLIDDADV